MPSHMAAVEKVDSDFIPLVGETFGIWTPFALKQLQAIADHTTLIVVKLLDMSSIETVLSIPKN